MNDAREAMPTFQGESQIVRIAFFFIESRAPGKQFQHPFRPFLDDDVHRLIITQSRPGFFRVIHMGLI